MGQQVVAEWGSYDGRSGRRAVSDPVEAEHLCREVEDLPGVGRVLLGFTAATGHYFGIGLGSDDSCATYWASADPPYFQSVGERPEGEVIDCAYEGEHTEFPGTMRIKRPDAFAALREFIRTGDRPTCVAWEET